MAGIIFVALKLHKYGGEIDFSRLGIKGFVIIVGLVMLYGIVNPMLAFGWRNLLAFSEVQVTYTWAFKVFGISQIAKYIPGNVFHFAGRQALGMSTGVAAMPLLKSSVWGLGFVIGTGALFGVLTLPALIPAISADISILLFTALCIVGFFCLFRFSLKLARAFCWYLFFHTATGFIFIGLLYLLSDSSVPLFFICGSYVLAWLAGFITPGAPAGIGIRELILLFLLKGMIIETDLLLAVLLGRFVTVGGDMLFFLIASIVPDQPQFNSTS